MKPKLITISTQIPQQLLITLESACKKEERSKSYFIKKALEEFLKSRIEKEEYSTIQNDFPSQ